MSINLRLREIIEEKGIKQAYICQKTGLSADIVSRILRGERKITAEEFLLICETLDLDPKLLTPLAKSTT